MRGEERKDENRGEGGARAGGGHTGREEKGIELR